MDLSVSIENADWEGEDLRLVETAENRHIWLITLTLGDVKRTFAHVI